MKYSFTVVGTIEAESNFSVEATLEEILNDKRIVECSIEDIDQVVEEDEEEPEEALEEPEE